MGFIKHGSNILHITAAAAMIIICIPYLTRQDASSQHILSALSQLSTIQGAASDDRSFTITAPSPAPSSVQRAVKLEDVLAEAAMPNKTVILTTLNEAWAANNSIIDIFLESFHAGENIAHLLHHLVIGCMDQTAYERCVQLHPHCLKIKTQGVDFRAEKKYMTKDYLKMVWAKIKFMRKVLQLGYSFVFTDGDIIWFRNPFPVFANHTWLDVQISTDRYIAGRGPFELRGQRPNSGFLYVRSNNRTIAMYKYWYEARLRHPGRNDQHVLTSIFLEDAFGSQVGVRVQFFSPVYFSGFCQVSKDMSKVVTMHSNCCVGLDRKLNDLRLVMDDWKLYKNASDTVNKSGNITVLPWQAHWRAPAKCKESFARPAL